ncbi:MSHA biogenesis protein MshK [Motiliproteus coralliicola]|uniref:MSHA biogenesis protein MshK n=1 Tax=Motiliproteus coralliicola TaxID=2283196 RepID=A0A369WA24_9GAMM|nr:MSHA biogenesis protein MshK [Motiliproteus coralliicola]
MLLLGLLPITTVQAAVDPTRPPSSLSTEAGQALPAQRWKLQSIRIGNGEARAVVNGVSVRVGQRIKGATVTSIKPGTLVLRQGGKRVQLHLGSSKMIKKNIRDSK